MKTRNGFVSNSSSCSFIVSLKTFPTTIALAEFMIFSRYLDKKEYYEEERNKLRTNPKLANEEIEFNEKRYRILNENISTIISTAKSTNTPSPNLCFKSCNFDTFITEIEVSKNKYIYVSTCNNEDWSEIDKTIPIEPIYQQEKVDDEPICYGFGTTHRDQYFNGGDLYDGLWDSSYVKGGTFICIDTLKSIVVEDQFWALREKT